MNVIIENESAYLVHFGKHTTLIFTMRSPDIEKLYNVCPGANFINKVPTIYLKLCVRCFLRSAYVSFIKTS